jgi:hypothetical protein
MLQPAAGKLMRHPIAQPGQTHHVEQCVTSTAALGCTKLADAQAKSDVALDRHVAEQRVVLKDIPDAALLGRERSDVMPIDQHAPSIGRRQPGDQAQDCTFTASTRPEQDEELTILPAWINSLISTVLPAPAPPNSPAFPPCSNGAGTFSASST